MLLMKLNRDKAGPRKKRNISVFRVKPYSGWAFPNLKELWGFRHLLYILAWRDIKVRYKQTILGAGWAIINPFITMIVFTFVFGKFAKVPSDGLPYPIFAYAALLPWQYFSSATGKASISLVSSANLISKIYFPRMTVVLSALIAPIVDFVIAFVILICMMLFYQIKITAAVILLPIFLLLCFLTALTVSLWFSALHVRYRDVGFIIPFLMEIWMFLTPVAYSSSLIPERWRILYTLNPLSAVVEGSRWALLGKGNLSVLSVFISFGIVVILLLMALLYFERTEATFVDIV